MAAFKEHSYEVLIREHHLDTYGHVNNATYLALYEEARWEYVTRGGYGYAEVHRHKKGSVILDIKVTFKKELRLRERITIRGRVVSYPGKIGTLTQEMVNEAGEICSTFEMTFGFFDLAARKLIAPTPEWLRALGVEP